MPKSIKKKRVLSLVFMLVTIVLTLLLVPSCDELDINPFNDKTTATSTSTDQQITETVSELPGKTEFTPTEEPGAPLGSPAYDMFLYIEGLPGESTDSDHEDWIDVLSYGWGVARPSAGIISSETTRSRESSLHMDFTIAKTLDKTSPKLALYCSKGQLINEAILVICRAEGGGEQIMEYRMTDLLISSVIVAGNAGGEMRPTEEIGLAYSEIQWIYTELDEMGLPKGNVEAYWEVETGMGE